MWVWSPDDDGAFTFKSAYSLIAGEMLNETYLGTETKVFKVFRKAWHRQKLLLTHRNSFIIGIL